MTVYIFRNFVYTILTILVCSSHIFADDSLSKALESWSRTLKTHNGYLITPPRGNISPNIKAAQSKVEEIIRYLAGPDLLNKKVNLMVNIYSSQSPNAWVREFDNISTGERQWEAQNQTKWPIRKVLGFSDNDYPIVEIAVSTALLQMLEYEDELAFVLGHELTHFFEEHTRHINFGHGQQHEVVADADGLARILGKYEISAAISAFMKLFGSKDNRPDSVSEEDRSAAFALGSSALTTHHHEGQRISLLQFLVEKYRRSTTKAERRELIPLKNYNLKSRKKDAFPDEDDLKNFPDFTEEYWDALNLYFLKDQIYYKVVDSRNDMGQENLSQTSMASSPSTRQVQNFVLAMIDKINESGVSKKTKINSFMQMLILYKRANPGFRGLWSALNDSGLHKVARFLVSNSIGESPWKAEELDVISENFSSSEKNHFFTAFLSEERGRRILLRISEIYKEWGKYYDQLFDLKHFFSDQKEIDIAALEKSLIFFLNQDAKEFGDSYKEKLSNMVYKITSLNPEIFVSALIKDKSSINAMKGLKYSLEWNKKNRTEESQKLSQAVTDYLKKKVEPLYLKRITSKAEEEILSDKITYSERVDLYKGLLQNTASYDYLDEKARSSLYNVFLSLAKSYDFSNTLTNNINLDENDLSLITGLLADKNYSLSDRIDVFHWASMQLKVEKNLFNEISEENQKNLDIFFKELNREDLINVLSYYPPLIEKYRKKYSTIINAEDKEQKIMQEEALFKMSSNDTFLEEDYRIYLEFKSALIEANLNMFKIFSQTSFASDFIKSLKKEDFYLLLHSLTEARNEIIHIDGMGHHENLQMIRHRNISQLLVEGFVGSFNEIKSFKDFQEILEELIFNIGDAFSWSVEQLDLMREKILSLINNFKPFSKYKVVKNPLIRKYLNNHDLALILSERVLDLMKGSVERPSLKAIIDKVEKDFDLLNSSKEVYVLMRNEISESMGLQPHEVDEIFPEDTKTNTEKTDQGFLIVKGFSGLLAATRVQPFSSQIEMIEYLMGRRESYPKFVDLTDTTLSEGRGGTSGELYLASGASFAAEVYKARQELSSRNELERSVVVNSFLTGPSGLFNNEESKKLLINKVLSSVEENNRSIARILIEALIDAEEETTSVFFSYILAQQSTGKPLSQALVLKSILDSYGVPGVKLAQYLAFTDEFRDFKDVLESYQDEAMPLTYYEMLQLVKNRMGNKWDPDKYEIIGMVGSGSVNIAIEYLNKETNEKEVMNISREDIEIKTKEDFRRFESLLIELGESEHNADGKFDFVLGLIKMISRSVSLEFDKEHAFEMQKSVLGTYNKEINGWKVRTVEAYEVYSDQMSILMQKAPGVGAKEVLKNNPELYKEAMSSLLEIEMEILRGVDESANLIPKAMIANPDLHNGQVLIDVNTKTVTILDFGQAEIITNKERLLAIDLLRIISGLESNASSKKLLRKGLKTAYPFFSVSNNFIEGIMEREDRMDRFIRLVSELDQLGYELPLSTVHWVFAANRLIKLGNKIGFSAEDVFRNIILTRKLGLPLSLYNAGSVIKESFKSKHHSQKSCFQILK